MKKRNKCKIVFISKIRTVPTLGKASDNIFILFFPAYARVPLCPQIYYIHYIEK